MPSALRLDDRVRWGLYGIFAVLFVTGAVWLIADALKDSPSGDFWQGISASLLMGVFARAGWADGNLEPWDFTDVDRTISGGVALSGKQWGRPDDTIGVAGIINNIVGIHQQFFNAGGLGILIGDGQLPHPGLEQIIEAYYSYALSSSTRVSVDYQFIANPAFNADRGPVNIFSARLHAEF